jgi:hypothetical protein
LSNKSESDILKSIGARVHPNSGRNYIKGDGSDAMFVWDVKEASKSFGLTEKVWLKVCTDAYKVSPYKNPGLFVVLGGTKKLAIIEMDVLQELLTIKEEWDRYNGTDNS